MPLQLKSVVARLKRQKSSSGSKSIKLSHLHKPPNMSLEEWQRELRRQFGRVQDYQLKNLGDEPIFSEFEVTNPLSRMAYRVRIRGSRPGDNFCSCPDFATNTLGTCKHVEFALSLLERKRGGAALLQAGHQPAYSEVYLQYGARREVRFRPGSASPVELARLAAAYFGLDGALLPDAFAKFETFLSESAKHEPELRCGEDALAFVAEIRDADERRRRVQQAFPRGIRSAAFKNLLAVSLYDYQREGALFAVRAGRCLLGDEMGLGKTVQGIAAAEIMARLFGVERVLVVCPTSLKHQWQREIERLCKRTVEVVGGLRPQREKCFETQSFFKIMNYDTVHADLDLIETWGPDLVILDEAQRIKNWSTRVARSVKRITSPYALVLTGTPLENRLEELISIVQFVDRFRLGPTFKLLDEHQLRDEYSKVVGYRNLDRLGQTLEPILLRRQKNQVLDQLPERIDNNVFVQMTKRQLQYHLENRDIVARIVNKWKRYGFLSEADKQKLMIALQMMRMSCDSSFLVDHQFDEGPKPDEAITLLAEYFERPETKVVVFSQWLRMHELLVKRVEDRRWGYVLFHGGVPGTKRKDLVDRFRDDPECRLFLSTDAGGVGLNLQHASVVMNMDLPWNPAVLEQRIGRVHRLGQRQPVRVVNFVAQGTIEEGMLGVLKFKKSLFAGVLDGGDKDVFMGGSRLTKFMETVEATTGAIPERMVEEMQEALPAPLPDRAEGEPMDERRKAKTHARAESESDVAQEELESAEENGSAGGETWTNLLQAGMAFLQQVTAPTSARPSAGKTVSTAAAALQTLVRRDEAGEAYLKLPVPPPDVLEQALHAIGALLQNFRK